MYTKWLDLTFALVLFAYVLFARAAHLRVRVRAVWAAYLVSHTTVMRLCSGLIILGKVSLSKEPFDTYRTSNPWHKNQLRDGDKRLAEAETMS